MKRKFGILLAVAMLAVLVIPVSASQSKLVPTTSIISVVQNQSVTIQTAYFPAYDTYNVTMGLSGTQGIGGVLVSRLTTGLGGSFLATFHIPPELAGQQIISIRLESPTSGYYSYNWFYNSTAAGVPANYYPTVVPYTPTSTWNHIQEGMPRFDIVAVHKGGSVDIRLQNYPANRTYTTQMADGPNSYRNTGWIDIGVFNSAAGGIINLTLNIPEILKYRPLIGIRIYDQSRKIYAVNMFYNE
jgi:hypothetical protein